ncbi:TPA: hypothetical protein DCQ23_01830, partial [Candidatus Uhrbacteria bacterium]|nr:hypothetical protein [Candidatus Uhrbacteria bacterium]
MIYLRAFCAYFGFSTPALSYSAKEDPMRNILILALLVSTACLPPAPPWDPGIDKITDTDADTDADSDSDTDTDADTDA